MPQLLTLHSRAQELQLLSPCAATTEAHTPGEYAPQQEKPLQWETRTPQQSSLQLKKAQAKQRRPRAAKIKRKKENPLKRLASSTLQGCSLCAYGMCLSDFILLWFTLEFFPVWSQGPSLGSPSLGLTRVKTWPSYRVPFSSNTFIEQEDECNLLSSFFLWL